jgi:hypothetical protein
MRNKRNKSTRRQKRINRQKGGDMADVERVILGLDVEGSNREKVIYAGALLGELNPELVPIMRLREEEREEARQAFNDALEAIYAKYDVTEDDIDLQREEVEEDLLDDEGADRLDEIANNIYAEFLKVSAPAAVPGVADRTRSKRPREGEELGEFEQIQPSNKKTSVFTLETTSKPEASITLSDGNQYNISQIKNMWTSNKSQTPLRHNYTEEDKAKIVAFINFAKGGKKSRKTKKAKKAKKTRKTK